MKLKDWVAITNGVDEFEIFGFGRYYLTEKTEMLDLYGEDEIDEVYIQADEEGAWVQANIYLK